MRLLVGSLTAGLIGWTCLALRAEERPGVPIIVEDDFDDPTNPLPYPITLAPPPKPKVNPNFPEITVAEFSPLPRLDFTFSPDLSKPTEKPKPFVSALDLPKGPNTAPIKLPAPGPVAPEKADGPNIETNTDDAEITPKEGFELDRKAAGSALVEGTKFLQQKLYGDALQKFEEGLTRLPDNHALLWNAGQAAYGAVQFGTAVDYWKRLKDLEPKSTRVRIKLIQAYQAAGLSKERDAERLELLNVYLLSRANLKKLTSFCRDQFSILGRKVLAFESFDPAVTEGIHLQFVVLNTAGDAECRICLAESTFATQTALDLREIKPDAKLFLLTALYPEHQTLISIFRSTPDYDKVRAKVVDLLNAKISPLAEVAEPAVEKVTIQVPSAD